MALIGYGRISTIGQNLDRQIEALREVGCTKIFKEKLTGKNMNRPELKAMMEYVREGDTVYVSAISRLARSTRDFLDIVKQITDKSVTLISLKEHINTSTPQGKFMLTVFSALAELELEQMLERQSEGIKIAKSKGIHMGRPKLVLPEEFDAVVARWRAKEITATQAWSELNMKKATFYKMVKLHYI